MEEVKETDNPEHTPKNKQVIRLRLFNLIKSWLQHHWIDFQDCPELVAEVLKFSGNVKFNLFISHKRTKELGRLLVLLVLLA